MDEQRSGSLRWNLRLVKTLGRVLKRQRTKQWEDLRGLTLVLQEILSVKRYQTASYTVEKSFMKGRLI